MLFPLNFQVSDGNAALRCNPSPVAWALSEELKFQHPSAVGTCGPHGFASGSWPAQKREALQLLGRGVAK
ncbi:hypothetical protein EG19_12075 [Thermoanaerobaculum aquaticum]|uniref:Uncharacterized protein n=1 Tax=Thermoanaerobaculum aquaticum TaxID=1312852 RepID=A0A062Y121_9BACT|nr:hypothetical protein EG19_12075 [Thermoanaerobaculum aquaticum]